MTSTTRIIAGTQRAGGRGAAAKSTCRSCRCSSPTLKLKRRALAAVGENTSWFVPNVEAMVEVDSTAVDAMESLRSELGLRGVFALARVKQDLRATLDAYRLTAASGPERPLPTRPAAVEAYRLSRPAPGSRDGRADAPAIPSPTDEPRSQ
ncbi:hypothetical protein [Nonomuraea sp. NPDC050310]|uniref:hypothetical protein n=1 Tax=Nonomuraea sp. NPDC050310 TaxID=3154935 RepID=UPI0033CED2CA